MSQQLEHDLHKAMLEVPFRIQSLANYNPQRLWLLVRKTGGLRAAKILLRNDRITMGLQVLSKAKCLDASIEYLVLQNRWRPLFTEQELRMAKSRLRQLGFNRF